jgi:hypothetical protein
LLLEITAKELKGKEIKRTIRQRKSQEKIEG